MKKNKSIIIIIIAVIIINIITLNYYSKGIIEKTIKNTYYLLIKNIKKIRNTNTFLINDSLSEIKELKEEVNTLKKTLELNNTISNFNYVNSTIISRNTNYWYNLIIVDKGSKDGIKINNPAITHDGLIGKVIETTKNTSTIELLTTEEFKNKISIKINDNIYGLITSYNIDTNTYNIEGISTNNEIKVGDIVYTTGLSKIYPAGIKVGTVKEINYDNFELERSIKVTPSVNFNNIPYITIII